MTELMSFDKLARKSLILGSKELIDHFCGSFQISRRVLQAEEPRFELGRREVDTSLQAKMEKSAKRRQIRFHRLGKIPDRLFCEEKAEHRAEAIELVVLPVPAQGISDGALHLLTKEFEASPAAHPFQFAQLAEAGGHGQRIAGESSSLVNRTLGRKHTHHVCAPAKGSDRQPASDHLAHCR